MPVKQAKIYPTKTYEPISLEKWILIVRAAYQYGIWIDQTQGKTEAFGVTFKWDYSEDEKRLKVSIVDPGFVSQEEATKFLDRIIVNA